MNTRKINNTIKTIEYKVTICFITPFISQQSLKFIFLEASERVVEGADLVFNILYDVLFNIAFV